jgi:uncharacterized phage-associated protein
MLDKETHSFDEFKDENSVKLSRQEPIKMNPEILPDNQDKTSCTESQLEDEKINWEKPRTENIKHEYQPNVFDIAAYIVNKLGTISTMKLQKLVYYAQAWSLVWDEKPLFQEKIEAWANGPVVRDLFYFHRGQFFVSSIPIGNPNLLNDTQKETVDAVSEFYGNRSAQWLIDLSHQEKPWQEARRGLTSNVASNRIISIDSIAEYYSSLENDE